MFYATDSESFEELKRKYPVLILQFTAEWCPPCKLISPILEKALAQSPDKLSVCRINVDKPFDLGFSYEVTGIPAVLLLHNNTIKQCNSLCYQLMGYDLKVLKSIINEAKKLHDSIVPAEQKPAS